MNNVHSLLLSDNISLDPQSLSEIEALINIMRERDVYSSLRWADLASDPRLAFLKDRNAGRRFNFIDYLTEKSRGSKYFSNLSGNDGQSHVLNYLLTLIAAEDAGFYDMGDFLNNKSSNASVSAFLFLLNDGVYPSVRGFTTLQRRIVVNYEAIREFKKTTFGSGFKIVEEFKEIRNISPAKNSKTDSQMMTRALIQSSLKKEFGDEFTPQSYVPFASLLLYKNLGAGPKEKKIMQHADKVLDSCGITKHLYRTRLVEAIIFYIMKRGDVKYKDIKNYLEKLFCIDNGGVHRIWRYEKCQDSTLEFRTELIKKYGKDNSIKFMIFELCERTMGSLGIKPKTKISYENKMRGE